MDTIADQCDFREWYCTHCGLCTVRPGIVQDLHCRYYTVLYYDVAALLCCTIPSTTAAIVAYCALNSTVLYCCSFDLIIILALWHNHQAFIQYIITNSIMLSYRITSHREILTFPSNSHVSDSISPVCIQNHEINPRYVLIKIFIKFS